MTDFTPKQAKQILNLIEGGPGSGKRKGAGGMKNSALPVSRRLKGPVGKGLVGPRGGA